MFIPTPRNTVKISEVVETAYGPIDATARGYSSRHKTFYWIGRSHSNGKWVVASKFQYDKVTKFHDVANRAFISFVGDFS